MIVRPRLHWFRLLFVWRGSVLPYIANRLLLVLAVSVLSVLGRDWWLSAHAASALSIPPFTLMGGGRPSDVYRLPDRFNGLF